MILAALSFPVTLALVGFVVDVGWAHFRKQAAQTAAQSAAFAGAIAAQNATNQTCANGWTCQGATACPSSLTTPGDPVQAACLYAIQNGFTNGSTRPAQTVTVAANTTSASSSGVSGVSPSYWIAVTVTERLPLTFLSVLGQQFATVSYKAISGVWLPSAGGCIYTLNTSAIDISMNGNNQINSGCGVYDNSNNGSAIDIVGNNAQITATAVNVVGQVSTHSPSQISPSPNLGVTAATDPFANMPAPTAGNCINYTTQTSLSGGTYCNQISKNNGTLTLDPGMYILQGGIDIGGNANLTMSGNPGDGSGGVTLYVTGGYIKFHGNDTVTLNAPTSGAYRGILLWQDKSDTQAATLDGGSALKLNGSVYLPKADLSYNGGTSSTNTTIVVDTLHLVGNAVIHAAASTPYTGTASGGAFLIQ